MRQTPISSPLLDVAGMSASTPTDRPASLAQAHLLLTFTFILYVLSVAVGLSWDGVWHATHLFNGFYVPPHLFIYSMVAVVAYLVATLTFTPSLRQWFGPGLRVPLFRFPVPSPLLLTGGGLMTLACAGGLDDLWHTNFGLDETGWSTPHAMIGWALLITALGFIACRLALRPWYGLPWYTVALLAAVALAFSQRPFIGPFGSNAPIEVIRAILRTPIILAQPTAQHTFRIYITWNITRANPLFVPLAALWTGAALAFLRRLDGRTRRFLAVVTVAWLLLLLRGLRDVSRWRQYFGLQEGRTLAYWFPIPFLPAALAYVGASKARWSERRSWLIAGLIFAVAALLVWARTPLGLALLVVSPLLLLLGARIGSWTFATISQPRRASVWAIILVGATMPFIVGMVDLYLRQHTP